MLGEPILNYGVGGETTSEGLLRLQRLLHRVLPSTVIVLEGWNDLHTGLAPSEVVDRVLQMALLIRQSGARPIVVTLLPNDGPLWVSLIPQIGSFNTLLQSKAQDTQLTVVDAAAAFAACQPLSKLYRHADGREDGLHPNDRGYRLPARTVALALR